MSIVWIILLTLFASFVGTLAGFGSSTIMLPIVILFFPFPVALLFVGIIHFLNDIWEMLLFKGSVQWKILLIFGTTGVIATLIGANLALSVNQVLLSRVLGALLIGFVTLINITPKFSLPISNTSLAVGGTASGFLAGIFGIGGPIRSLFLTGYKLPKKTYLFTIGALSLVVDITRISAYLVGGARLPQTLLLSVFFLIPVSLFAAEAAKLVVDKINQKAFQVVISVFLVVIGLKFLLFP